MKFFRKSKNEEPSAAGQLKIKKKSSVPGVMITQFVEELPAGMTTPDFIRKPIALTIQEGKLAFFKAIVSGNPKPTVHWTRNNGEITDPEKYIISSDPTSNNEYYIEMPEVSPDQADTYKCIAANEYGKAVVTATLNVIEMGYKKSKAMQDARAGLLVEPNKAEKKDGEIDPRFWDVLMSANKKDYENICTEFGVTNFRWMLKTLNAKKVEREEEQAKFIEQLSNLKHIEVKPGGGAEFEIEMSLKDPNLKVFLFKDGEMIPFSLDSEEKHFLKKTGRRYTFGIKDLGGDDGGLYQVIVGGVPIFSTDFKVPMVDFLVKIQEVKATERQDAVFECVLSSPMSKIHWVGKNQPCEQGEKFDIEVSEDMLIHRLVIKDCEKLDGGIYSASVGIKSCNAFLVVEVDNNPASKGKKKVRNTTRAGVSDVDLVKIASEQQAKLEKERDEKMELAKQLKAEMDALAAEESQSEPEDIHENEMTGNYAMGENDAKEKEDKKLKKPKEDKKQKKYEKKENNENETIEASEEKEDHMPKPNSKPSEQEKEEINPDNLADFSKPVIIKVGQSATFKLSFMGHEPMKITWYNEDEELESDKHIHIEKSLSDSRLLLSKCQRKASGEIKIKIKNECGTIEAISRLIVLDRPSPPLGPVEIIEASSSALEFKWRPPKDEGGCPVINYILERQQLGRNSWMKLGQIPGEAKYRDTNIDHGRKYCYHIRAVTEQGISEVMETDDIQAGTRAYPGPPSSPKVISAFANCINLEWIPPSNPGGTNIVGYHLEKRKKGSNLWGSINHMNEPIKGQAFAVKDVIEGMEYEFRVAAINTSGAGEPSTPSEFIIARDPKMRPKFTDRKMKSFMVVRAGNSARININFASPMPTITWLKDGMPVSKRVTISNSDITSQLLIPTSERQDTGIYSVIIKNMVGQETFSVEIRVTDDPKPAGPVVVDQNVPGTVTVTWTPSPDEKRDDRLYYIVSMRDSVKRMWQTVADRLFNNKFTVLNIMAGREYYFRVYAKNDMGLSEPSESPVWGNQNIFTPSKDCSFETVPSFLVPLKTHSSPESYECYMSCAVRGTPTPHVSWYRNNVSLNTNTNYLITNTCGVCSMVILRVGAKDSGEYKVIADNSLGRAECSTNLTVQGIKSIYFATLKYSIYNMCKIMH
uniref:Immunoglobulin like and fibronectin type III domain containing 1, tandem duplicate 3 n=1 Tax=Esox lucius TaxID=8010 RepID=A0A6Q2XMI2_ESOLU